jgi:tetratricopeptide (TPR) repeat protein
MSQKPYPKPSPLSSTKRLELERRSGTLLAQKDRSAIEPACRQLLRDFPDQPIAHFLLARTLVDTDRHRDAFPYAEAAHKLAPHDPNFAFYLGFLYLEFDLYEFALPLLKQAVRDDHENAAQFHETLGQCYQEIGMGEQAAAHLTKSLQYDDLQELQDKRTVMLVRILIAAGKTEEARPHIEALKSLPGKARLHAAADAAWIASGGVTSPEGQNIIALLADETLQDAERASLLLSLGHLHERDKNYDAAFSQWVQSREIARRSNWHLKDQATLLRGITTFYSRDLVRLLEPFGHPSTEPVFIVGMPRSGTTLTEQIIAAHPDAAGAGELSRFRRLAQVFQRDYEKLEDGLTKLKANAAGGELKARAEENLIALRLVAGRPAKRIIEKTPHNFEAAGYLRLCFPKARFIHCLRHPLDTFISSFQNDLNKVGHAYAYDLVPYGEEYLYHINLMNHWKSLFPEQIFTLRYEDMAQDPETWARKIIDFVGLPWNGECLKFFEKAGTVLTISNQQIRKPVYSTSVDRWRRYEKHLGPLTATLERAGFTYPST